MKINLTLVALLALLLVITTCAYADTNPVEWWDTKGYTLEEDTLYGSTNDLSIDRYQPDTFVGSYKGEFIISFPYSESDHVLIASFKTNTERNLFLDVLYDFCVAFDWDYVSFEEHDAIADEPIKTDDYQIFYNNEYEVNGVNQRFNNLDDFFSCIRDLVD